MRALGSLHARDRPMQMLTSRLMAQGRLCEHVRDTPETFGFDCLARRMRFYDPAELTLLTPATLAYAEAYCDSVNRSLKTPLYLRLRCYTPPPWTPLDILALLKMHMYVGMAQMQERTERFLIQALYDGVALPILKRLFAPHLEGLDEETVALIRQTPLRKPYFSCPFTPGASNNWVIAPSKSTGGALMAFDPHLMIGGLPSTWYEVNEPEGMGVTVPGIPGLIMGRTHNLAASFTYGMMDTFDFFLEQADSGWTERTEVIKRKRGEVELTFQEKEGRLLEGGYSIAWSGHGGAAAVTLNALAQCWEQPDVARALPLVAQVGMPCNWLLADRQGNIAYQQSGRRPRRKHSGLYPVIATPETIWQGWEAPLPPILNPKEGFLASANDARPGVTAPYASYRFERISAVLKESKEVSLSLMQKLQNDTLSLQAKQLLPKDHPLAVWDGEYRVEAKEPVLFEKLYSQVLTQVFAPIFGNEAWKRLSEEHSLLVYLHGHFDRYLLEENPVWETALPTSTWGEEQTLRIHPLLFGKCTLFDLGLIHCLGDAPPSMPSPTFGWGGARSQQAPPIAL